MSPKTDFPNKNPLRDGPLSALADAHCRLVLAYLKDMDEDHASVDDLATALALRSHTDETRIATRLHHIVLPKLDDVGLVDYDARTRTVRYRGHAQLEGVQAYLSEPDLWIPRRRG